MRTSGSSGVVAESRPLHALRVHVERALEFCALRPRLLPAVRRSVISRDSSSPHGPFTLGELSRLKVNVLRAACCTWSALLHFALRMRQSPAQSLSMATASADALNKNSRSACSGYRGSLGAEGRQPGSRPRTRSTLSISAYRGTDNRPQRRSQYCQPRRATASASTSSAPRNAARKRTAGDRRDLGGRPTTARAACCTWKIFPSSEAAAITRSQTQSSQPLKGTASASAVSTGNSSSPRGPFGLSANGLEAEGQTPVRALLSTWSALLRFGPLRQRQSYERGSR